MRRRKLRRAGDWLIKFAIDRFVIFFVRLGLFKPQSSSARKPGAIIGETFTASLRLTRGSSLDLEIALGGVPAKDQPHGLFSPADRCVETSDDVIAVRLLNPRHSCQVSCWGAVIVSSHA